MKLVFLVYYYQDNNNLSVRISGTAGSAKL
jgi:hypothetical protein